MSNDAVNAKFLKTRGYANFFEFSGKNFKEVSGKNLKEEGVAEEFIQALYANSGVEISDFRQHPNGENAAPDLEFTFGAERWGIELTELVNQRAIEEVQRGKPIEGNWPDEILEQKIKEILDIKDKKNWGNEGTYDCYVLVIHTDEPQLTEQRMRTFLEKHSFQTQLIKRAFVLISYDPSVSGYPLLSIDLKNHQPANSTEKVGSVVQSI